MNILIFDNNGVFGAGIQAILKSQFDMKVIGVYKDKAEILKAFQEYSADILLINAGNLKTADISAVGWLKRKYPVIKVIYILPERDKRIVLEGLHIGVEGFFLYESDPQFFLDSMRNIFNEEMIISGRLAKYLIEEITPKRKELSQHN